MNQNNLKNVLLGCVQGWSYRGQGVAAAQQIALPPQLLIK